MPGNPLLKGKSKGGHNPSGANGTGNGDCKCTMPTFGMTASDTDIGPEEDVLKGSLQQYARERLTLDQRVRRLKDEHNLIIGYVGFQWWH
jgi:hypothetical protein